MTYRGSYDHKNSKQKNKFLSFGNFIPDLLILDICDSQQYVSLNCSYLLAICILARVGENNIDIPIMQNIFRARLSLLLFLIAIFLFFNSNSYCSFSILEAIATFFLLLLAIIFKEKRVQLLLLEER